MMLDPQIRTQLLNRQKAWEQTLPDLLRKEIGQYQPFTVRGKVREVVGTVIEATVTGTKLGELCILENHDGRQMSSEVIGFRNEITLLSALGEMAGISTETAVTPTGRVLDIAVGEELLGRVLDGLGNPSGDGGGPIHVTARRGIHATPPPPLSRQVISRALSVGVPAIDGLLTCGEGQRVGVFAASGVGKTTLLGTIVKNTEADVIVIALIGERGREVREFIEHNLDEESRARSVTVVATSDRPALERMKAAHVATTIAEYFRDQDKRVLLLMDSVTRFARALREVGLAAGEPPTRRGFPPSVFASLPRLFERAGTSDRGSITAIYTVLVEGDDMTEPIADETRSILDGHIILSRELATSGHYPAIDVLASISRVMDQVVDTGHIAAAQRIRQLMAKYQEVELLVKIGEYQEGNDPAADLAIAARPAILDFLKSSACSRHRLAIDQMRSIAEKFTQSSP